MARILADQRHLAREGERWLAWGRRLETLEGQVDRLNWQLRSKLKSRDQLGYHINPLSKRLGRISRDAIALEKLLEVMEQHYRMAETEAASWAEEADGTPPYQGLLPLAGAPALKEPVFGAPAFGTPRFGAPALGVLAGGKDKHVLMEENNFVKREAVSWRWGSTRTVGYVGGAGGVGRVGIAREVGDAGKVGNVGEDGIVGGVGIAREDGIAREVGNAGEDGIAGEVGIAEEVEIARDVGTIWEVCAEAGLWGRERKAAELGKAAVLGMAASEHGWATRGEVKGIWGPLSLEGGGEAISWEADMEMGYSGPLSDGWGGVENGLSWLPQGYASAALSVSGLTGELEAALSGEEAAFSIGGNGALGYAEAVFDTAVGRQPDGGFGVSNQISLEVGAVKGEAKAGFALWGIECSLGLEGKVDAVGASGGYEISTNRLRFNLGAALGAGLEVNAELDWSGFQMPGRTSELVSGQTLEQLSGQTSEQVQRKLSEDSPTSTGGGRNRQKQV